MIVIFAKLIHKANNYTIITYIIKIKLLSDESLKFLARVTEQRKAR